MRKLSLVSLVVGFALAVQAIATQAANLTVAVATPQSYSESRLRTPEYVFTAAPRENGAEDGEHYQAIADFLTLATGAKFSYRNPGNWLSYQNEMRKGDYDLVFDGPHFVGWRARQIGHAPLLKLPQPLVWVVVTRADSPLKSIKELAGRRVCVHAPPNLGTLTLQSLFDNPARQPYLIEIKGWQAAYQGVAEGRCDATILPRDNLRKYDPDGRVAKVVHQHQPYPNQAFTAGPRITPQLRARIVAALMSEHGRQITAPLRERFGQGADMVPASMDEYQEAALVLKTYWGFEF